MASFLKHILGSSTFDFEDFARVRFDLVLPEFLQILISPSESNTGVSRRSGRVTGMSSSNYAFHISWSAPGYDKTNS